MAEILDVENVYTMCQTFRGPFIGGSPAPMAGLVVRWDISRHGMPGVVTGQLYGPPGEYLGSHILGEGHLQSFLRNDGVVFSYVRPSGIEGVVEFTQMVSTTRLATANAIAHVRNSEEIWTTPTTRLNRRNHRHPNLLLSRLTWPDPDACMIAPRTGCLVAWLREGDRG